MHKHQALTHYAVDFDGFVVLGLLWQKVQRVWVVKVMKEENKLHVLMLVNKIILKANVLLWPDSESTYRHSVIAALRVEQP